MRQTRGRPRAQVTVDASSHRGLLGILGGSGKKMNLDRDAQKKVKLSQSRQCLELSVHSCGGLNNFGRRMRGWLIKKHVRVVRVVDLSGTICTRESLIE